jgi:hypothetical protein
MIHILYLKSLHQPLPISWSIRRVLWPVGVGVQVLVRRAQHAYSEVGVVEPAPVPAVDDRVIRVPSMDAPRALPFLWAQAGGGEVVGASIGGCAARLFL